MNHKPTLRQRWQYFFDMFMSRGTPALIGGLFLISLVIILLAGLVISLGGRMLGPETEPGVTQALTFGEAAWEALMRTLDAGTMGGDSGWGYRWSMFIVTLGGVFFISTLIGVLTSGVEAKLEQLRKGRSLVLEQGHTVILGWSPMVFSIISELVIANLNQKHACIVLLADQDKVEMEDALRERLGNTYTTRLICRSGDPIDLADLEIVSPHTARSIIVLPPEGDDPDSFVIKAILALTNNPNRRPDKYNIVTLVRDPRNLDVVRLIGEKDNLHPLLSGELIARVIAQTTRQPGLSVVYTELLNFSGDEIYFKGEPGLSGRTYGEALLAYEDSTVIGLRFADGRVQLNPPMDTRLTPDDQVIAISADDDTIHLSGHTRPPVQPQYIRSAGKPSRPSTEDCLILGWNHSGIAILRELDNYVPKGSRVLVVAEQDIRSELKDGCGRLVNQKVSFQKGDSTDRQLLDGLKVAGYDHVIVLSDAGLDVQQADARTLVTLLHLRGIASREQTTFSIISQMLDLRNRELAEVTRVDDFIVSDHLISLMLAQLSENGELFDVFADLFNPQGSEVYQRPVSAYVQAGQPANFYTVVEAARLRGETALGYRLASESDDPGRTYGVHTNPPKSDVVSFQEGDQLIVLAEG